MGRRDGPGGRAALRPPFRGMSPRPYIARTGGGSPRRAATAPSGSGRRRGRQDVAVLHGHSGNVTAVAFTPDGRRLASVSRASMLNIAGDDTIRSWDVDPRATLPVLRGHTSYVYPVAFSPDGRWIASGGWDNTVVLWDAATGEPCATLPHPGIVHDLAFGPDGTWLVGASLADSRLRIWDVAAARLRKEIELPAGRLRFVTVRPDGRRLAVDGDPPGGYGFPSARLRRRVRRAAVLDRWGRPGLQPRRPLAGGWRRR